VDDEKLLTGAECAALWRVDPATITRWARQELIPCVRTPGGRRRYRESEMRALIAGRTVLRAVDVA